MVFSGRGSQGDEWPRQMAVAVADDYFDGTSSVSRVRAHFAVAKSVHARYLRCAFSWNAIEKSPGKYDWKFWDMLVHEAQASGVKLIPYVAYTPRWAARDGNEFWTQPPKNQQDFANFMYTIVRRYRGKIDSWEIWNEPDNRDYWKGSVSEYAQLVERAAIQMRKADPSIVLVLGGMSRGPGPFFNSLLSDYKIGRYVDVIAMHAYPETWGEERVETVFTKQVDKMAAMVRQQGDGADFWMNEMGYADYRFLPGQASKWGISITYNYEHTREYQATSLFKMEVMSVAFPQISLTGWYRIDDFSPRTSHFSDDEVNYHLGLRDANGNSKPDFLALKFFDSLFDEPVQLVPADLRNVTNPGIILDEFRRTDGKIVIIGWLPSSLNSDGRQPAGLAVDHRVASVSVHTLCAAISSIRFYNDAGAELADPTAVFQNGWLTNIDLRGSSIFISVLSCAHS